MNENTIPGVSLRPLKPAKSAKRIPCLVLYNGDSMETVFRLSRPSHVIGRDSQSDILLSREGVSRQHARVDRHDESFAITDLQSLNGTLLNDEPIEQAVLKDGDRLTFGDTVLRFSFLDELKLEFHDAVRERAVQDHLTHVANRQFFLEMLRKETSYSLRQGQPLSCIMMDIDRLKKINDEHGPEAGDLVLRKIATHLSDGLRSYDVLCRYGGEEFAILLRDTALANALVFSERLRKRTETLEIAHAGGKLSVTLSVGVASLNPNYVQDAMDLVREADRHLYTAKAQGGNRVCSARTNV